MRMLTLGAALLSTVASADPLRETIVLAEQAFDGGTARLDVVATSYSVALKLYNPTTVRVRAVVEVTVECSLKRPTSVARRLVLIAPPKTNLDFGNTVDCPGLSPRTSHKATGVLELAETKQMGACLIDEHGQLKLPATRVLRNPKGLVTAIQFKGTTTQTIRIDTLEQKLGLDAGFGQALLPDAKTNAISSSYVEVIAETVCAGAVTEARRISGELALEVAAKVVGRAFKESNDAPQANTADGTRD